MHTEKRNLTWAIGLLLVISLLFTACQSPVQDTTDSATETAVAELAQQATDMSATLDAQPTVTRTLEPTPIPTSTPRPTDIPPTPTLELPVSVLTPVPFQDQEINASNASSVALLAIYGKGTIEEIAVSPSGRWVVAATISGVSVYQTGAPDAAQHYLRNQTVRSVAIAPNGEMIATGLQSGELVIMSISDGEIQHRLPAHESGVFAVAYAPDGSMIASGGADGVIKLWNAEDGSVVNEINAHTGRVNDIAFSPDSLSLASGSIDRTVKIWTVEGEQVASYTAQNGAITAVAFSNDGRRLASGSAEFPDYTTFIRNLTDEEALPIVLNNDNIVRSIAFSNDDRQIAIGGDDYGVDIWELFDEDDNYLGFRSQLLTHDFTVISLAYLPDDVTLVTATWDTVINWWNLTDREITQRIDRGLLIGTDYIDNRPLISSQSAVGDLLVYDGDTLEDILVIEEAHPASLYRAAISPNSEWVVTISFDGFRVWDMQSGEVVFEDVVNDAIITAIEWSSDSQYLGVGFNNGDIEIYSTQTQQAQVFDKSNQRILSLAFSPDLNLVASAGDDGQPQIWRLSDGETLATLTGHTDAVWDILFSPDGTTLATASSDYNVILWQGITGEASEYGAIQVVLRDHTFRVKGVAFSPDSSLLVSVSDDGSAILWNTANGQRINTLTGLTGDVRNVQFNQDGTLFYTWDWDGIMRIFGIPVQ
jgi:WD40 repeat protein